MNEYIEYAKEQRSRLHRIPEASFREFETTKAICGELEAMGAEVIKWDDLTGATGLIRASRPGPVIGIRADIDALPIEEPGSGLGVSAHPGYMHACGHDGHAATALAVGKWFAENRDRLFGSLKLIFQPGEETMPGGAREMLKRGVLESPHVDAIFALHTAPDIDIGRIGVCAGEFLVGVQKFSLEMKCAGGAGFAPEEGKDGILLAAEFITSLQARLNRRLPPDRPGLVTIGTINGGDYAGALAPSVRMEGVMRSFNRTTMLALPELIEEAAKEIVGPASGSVSMECGSAYPPVWNDPDAAMLVYRSARECLGPDGVIYRTGPMAGSDDMSIFLEHVPGCYFLWGIREPGQKVRRAHTPEFGFPPEALDSSVRVMISTVEAALDCKWKGGNNHW